MRGGGGGRGVRSGGIPAVRRRRAARREQRGNSVVALVPDDAELSRIWDGEAEAVLLERALGELQRSTRLKPQTCEAFRLHVIEHWSPEAIAARLQMTVRSVYLAKHRCLNHLRTILSSLQAAYELE
jgi:DNA-directed RNA polymerase specialized sigma24 family protein